MYSSPFDFFDKIYCINLPRSKDRWSTVSKVFERVGILDKVERIWADPPAQSFKMSNFNYPAGEFGVCLSHGKALVKAMHDSAKNFLLFEDDIDFINGGIERLTEAINEIPSNWDIFYLGGNPREPLHKISKNLSKTGFFYGGFSYAVNSKSFFEIYSQHLNYISKPFPTSTYDYSLALYAAEHNAYCIDPYVCKNIAGHSIIRNAHRDYDKVISELWEEFGSHNIDKPKPSLQDALKK